MNTRKPTAPATPRTLHGKPSRRILIVEDDEALGSLLVRVLTEGGFQATLVTTGDDAVQSVLVESYDIILSDIKLPGVSGLDLLSIIRAYDTDMPVVLMTGGATVDTAVRALNLGATQYLLKPFDNDVLVHACNQAADLRAKRRAERAAPAAVDSSLSLRGLGEQFDRALSGMWMAFQPIVDSSSVVAYEALLRSNEPTLPNPPAVLEAAERLGRLHELGQRVRDLSATAFSQAPRNSLLFVNLHANDLLDPSLYLATAPLTQYAERVVLEVTERASLSQIDSLLPRISMLRVLGFRLAVDDLGAGYAGLSSFAELEPEFVKLDMSLVRDIHQSPVRRKLVSAMASLAHELGAQVVAEGVENEAESKCVQEHGCNLLQGYFFARPGKPFPSADHLGHS